MVSWQTIQFGLGPQYLIKSTGELSYKINLIAQSN